MIAAMLIATMPPPDPDYIGTIAASVKFWRAKATGHTEKSIIRLDRDRQNLYRLVKEGMRLPETAPQTIQLCLDLFDLVERRGYWPEWIPILQKAIATQQADSATQVKLHNRLGQLNRLLGNFDEALNAHNTAAKLSEALHDSQLQGETAYNFSRYFYQLRKFQEAQQQAQIALQKFELANADSKWKASIFNTIGCIAINQSERSKAEEYLLRSVKILDELGQDLLLVRSQSDLAIVYTQMQQYELARDYLEAAQKRLVGTLYDLDKAMLYINLGNLYFQEEKWFEAEKAFRHAEKLLPPNTPHIFYQTTNFNNLGNTLLKIGRLNEAQGYLAWAIKNWRKLKSDVSLANTLGTLAEVEVKLENRGKAIAHYEEAIGLLEANPDNPWGKRLLKKFRTARDTL